MRSLRVELLSCLAVVCLAVAMLVVGIWAAGTQTINLKGQVDFSISDPSLYVKDIRIKNSMEDASYSGETIDNFVPGYVNTTMNLNLGQIDNSTGGLSIYIDIINTTDTTYVASTTSSISGAEITVSGTINADAVSQSNILTTDIPSGTVEIMISAPNIATLDLSQINIVLEEKTIYNVTFDVTAFPTTFFIKSDYSETVYETNDTNRVVSVPVNSLISISTDQSILTSAFTINDVSVKKELEVRAPSYGASLNINNITIAMYAFGAGSGDGFTAVENDIVNTYTNEDNKILYIEVTSDIEITFLAA